MAGTLRMMLAIAVLISDVLLGVLCFALYVHTQELRYLIGLCVVQVVLQPLVIVGFVQAHKNRLEKLQAFALRQGLQFDKEVDSMSFNWLGDLDLFDRYKATPFGPITGTSRDVPGGDEKNRQR